MKKYYSYGDLNICIDIDDEYMYIDDYVLKNFRTDVLDDCYYFRFNIVNELSKPSLPLVHTEDGYREYSDGILRERYIGGVKDDLSFALMKVSINDKEYICEVRSDTIDGYIPVHTLFHILETERLVASNGGIVLHSSYIIHNDEAILFSAPCGTGKSTQAMLWNKYRNALIVNGDRCIIKKKDNRFYAYGLPLSGSSKITLNRNVPIKAIVYLTQSKSNTITRLNGFKAFKVLYEGSGVLLWDRYINECICKTIEDIVLNIPVYVLNCTPDEDAVKTLENMLGD